MRPARSEVIGVVLPLLLWGALMAVVVPALRTPERIDPVTVHNPHPWWVHVEVTDTTRDGWVGVGTVDRDASHDFREVIDMGDRWTLRFTYSSAVVEVTVDRADLVADGWQITVPDGFAQQLRARAVPETPRS